MKLTLVFPSRASLRERRRSNVIASLVEKYRIERYEVDKPPSCSHFTAAQKALALFGIVAGGLNWASISGTSNL